MTLNRNLRAVLFDFDYTLGDSSAAILACVKHAMVKLGLPAPSDDEIHRAIGMPVVEMYYRFMRVPEVDRAREQERALAFHRLFHSRADEIMVGLSTVYPGVPEMAESLVQRGLKLGVVTTKYRFRVEAIFARDNLAHLFSIIVGSEDVARPKPAPEALLLALAKLGLGSDEVLYVGDSEIDALAAKSAGIRFAAVLTGATPREALEAHNPVAVLDHASSVPSLLARL